jgi:type II secretion system protein D
VRISSDARTSQVLVLAPPAVHQQIAARMPGNDTSAIPEHPPARPKPEQPLPALPPTKRQLVLKAVTWDQMESSLASICGERFALAEPARGDQKSYKLTFPKRGDVHLVAEGGTGMVELQGHPSLIEPCERLIRILDTAPSAGGRVTRVVPVKNAQIDNIRQAVRVLRTPEAAPPQGEGEVVNPLRPGAGQQPAIPMVARLFQPRPQPPAGPNQPAPQGPQPAPNGQPQPEAMQPGQMPELPLENELFGPVQIEYIPELDQLIIIGQPRDVETVMRIIDEIERRSVETAPIVEVYHLRHTGSEAMATIINQLNEQVLSARQGFVSIVPLVKPNALLLIGRAESVATIRSLIEQLDQPVGPTSQFSVFHLKHASAAAAQAMVTEFFAGRTGLGTRVLVTGDFRSNSLIVQGSPRDLAEVAAFIQEIDRANTPAVNELRVFPLSNSFAEDLALVLQQAIAAQTGRPTAAPGQAGAQLLQQAAPTGAAGVGGTTVQQQQLQAVKSMMLQFATIDSQGRRRVLNSGILTDVRITADPRANALLVSAPPETMDLIESLIRLLDEIPAAEAQIKVFHIINGDAANLVLMLEDLFGQRQQAGGGGQFGAFGGGGAAQQGQIQGENPLVPMRFSVDQRTNSIIAAGGAADLVVVEAILTRLDAEDVRQRQSIVYRLKNSPAVDVALAINEFLRSEREVQQITPGVVSPFEQIEREVVVVPEPVSNSLIVSATPRYFEEIKAIVEQLDARPPMVMIQVLIAEVALANTDEFGVELGLQDSILFDRSLLGEIVTTDVTSQQAVPGGGTITTTNQIIQAATLVPGFLFNNQPLGNSGSTTSVATADQVAGQALTNFSVGRINGNLGFGGLVLSASSESVSILIRALKECRRLDVLSRPQIMTLDNQSAFIQVGSRVPRVTGVTVTEVGQTNNVIDENVGLILGVTPRISPDGLVVMLIDAERSALGPEAEGVPVSISATGEVVRQPVINTTTASTTVAAVSGQTIVLGGLITKNKSVTKRRVPLLSDVPVLGNLFRYDAEQILRTELLIVMTPHIVRTREDAEVVKQIEAARMSWVLSDVEKIHGSLGLAQRGLDWHGVETVTVYPDADPTGAKPLMPIPEGTVVPGPVPPGVAPGPVTPGVPTVPPPDTLPPPPGRQQVPPPPNQLPDSLPPQSRSIRTPAQPRPMAASPAAGPAIPGPVLNAPNTSRDGTAQAAQVDPVVYYSGRVMPLPRVERR